jgi:predicted nucleotidyltransferase
MPGVRQDASVWDQRDRDATAARDEAVAAIRALLPAAIDVLRRAGCTEAWLTGSFARGDPRPGSDVDVLARGLDPATRADVWIALEELFGRPVDLAEIERIPPERLDLALHGARRLFP